jgi:two-component system, OmpR family, heavy metal sensor histidine kinase CusS
MKRLSIGVRLTLWYLVIFALGEVVFGVGMWFILRDSVLDMVDDDIETQVDDLSHLLATQANDVSVSTLQALMKEAYGSEHWGDYLAIYTGDGQTLYQSVSLQSDSLLMAPQAVQKTIYTSREIRGRHFRFIFQRLSSRGRTYVVEAGLPADDAFDTLRLFRSYLFLFAPLLLLIAAGVGYWMSRRALAPVDALVRTARAVSGTNLSTRLEKLHTGDELQRLSDTLNEMLDRIEASVSRITQFTADASHELRTPVSLIRTEAELSLRRARSQNEYQDSLRHILLEAERTTALIEQLLSVARADLGGETLQLQPVDLSTMLQGVAEAWKQVAAIRDLRFSTNLPHSDASVAGDENLLRRVADILLDNAFKYTPAPGSVSLSLEAREHFATITIQDSGIGIPEAEQGKIFERFYRVDKSRARGQGGNGLGLSIAQWIITQHRGTVVVESRPGEGTIFRVELPTIATPVRNPQPA